MADNNSNTSFDNCKSETKLYDFSFPNISTYSQGKKSVIKKLYIALRSTEVRFAQTDIRS